MGRFLFVLSDSLDSRDIHFSPIKGTPEMNAHIKSYLIFLGYLAVTKMVVAPVVKQLNIPVVSDLLA